MSDAQQQMSLLPDIEPAVDFDYESLDASTRIALNVSEDKLRTLVRRTVEDYLAIGLELIAQREFLKGRFLAWTRSAFGWGSGETYRHIYAAEHLGECSAVDNFHLRALSLFTTKKIDPAVVAAAIELAESGQSVTRDTVKELINQHGGGDGDAPPADEELQGDADPVDQPAAGDPMGGDDAESANADESENAGDLRDGPPADESSPAADPEILDPEPLEEVEDVTRRPFAILPPLPREIDEPFQDFKIAILTHKLKGWRDFSRSNLEITLQCLKDFADAPKE